MLEMQNLAFGIRKEKCNFQPQKQINNKIQIIPQIKISLRGGGCNNTKQLRQENIIQQLLILLNQIKEKLKVSQYYQSYQLMKDCLNKIQHVYLNSFDNYIFIEKYIYENQFKEIIQKANDEILKQQSSRWIDGLYNYLELIDISLKSLSRDSFFNKRISIIKIFIEILQKIYDKNVIKQFIEAAKFLLIDVQCRYYTQFQKYETFFFFQTLSYIVKKQIEARLTIEFCTYFQTIQEQFILNSINWTLHNYWIEFQVDLCLFCNKYLLKNKNLKLKSLEEVQKIVNFFMKVPNENGRAQFKLYEHIKNFQFNNDFKFKLENSWINDIDNSGFHRLKRILSVLSNQVNEIETKYVEFQQSKKSSLIDQIYNYFQGTQICLLEIAQQLSIEEEKCQLYYEQNQLQILLKTYQKIDYIQILKYYCQNTCQSQDLQGIENRTDLKEQIQLLNQIIEIVSAFIMQVIQQKLKVLPQENLQSQNFISHSFQSFKIENKKQDGLYFSIKLYLQLLTHALQMQNIYQQKLFQIKYFFDLDQKYQENQLPNNLIQEKINNCKSQMSKKLTRMKQNFEQDFPIVRQQLIKKVEKVLSFCQFFVNDDEVRKTIHKNFKEIRSYLQQSFVSEDDVEKKNDKIYNLFNEIQQELDKTDYISFPNLKTEELKQKIQKSQNIQEEIMQNSETLNECYKKLQKSELNEEQVNQIFNPIEQKFNFNILNLIIKGEDLFQQKENSQLLDYFYSSISNWQLEFKIKDINYKLVYEQIEQIIDQEQKVSQHVQQSMRFYQEYFKYSNLDIKYTEQTEQILSREIEIAERQKKQLIPFNQGQLENDYENDIIFKKDQFFNQFEEIIKIKKNMTNINVGLRVKEIIKDQIIKKGETKQLLIEFEYKNNPEQYLQAEINKFIWCQNNPNVMMLIFGRKGSGKTKSMKRLEKLLWNLYKACPLNPNWIPIYIDLSKLRNPSELTLKKAIKEYFQCLNQVTNFLKEILQGKVNVVLILDGCDQKDICKAIYENNQFQFKICNYANNNKISLKIIMTIKQDCLNFETLNSELNFKNTQILEIQPFDYNQQLEYIKQYQKDQLKQKIQKIVDPQSNQILEQIDQILLQIDQSFVINLEEVKIILNQNLINILDLLKKNQLKINLIEEEFNKINYFLENIIMKNLKDILITPKMIEIAINKLEEQYLNVNSKKIIEQFKTKFIELKEKSLGKNQYQNELEEMLNQLNKTKFFEIYHPFDTLKLEKINSIKLKDEIFRLNEDADLVILALDQIKLSRYKILDSFIIEYYQYLNQDKEKGLNNNQESKCKDKIINYYMIDDTLEQQCLKDYFFAKRILELLQIDEQKQMQPENFKNQEFNLSSQDNEGTVELLIDELKQIKHINQHLIRIIKLSKYNEEFKRSSSNALYLLYKLGVALDQEDFEGIIIEDINIQGLSLMNCNLKNSKVNNLNIDYCNLNYVNLNGADWENIVCSEIPTIFEEEQINQVIIFNNDKQLAVLKYNSISIWDILTCEKKCTDLQHFLKRNYKQMQISNDESKLFALTNLEIDVWSLSNYQMKTTKPLLQGKSIYFSLSPNNNLLACSLEDSSLLLFRLAEREKFNFKLELKVNQLAFNDTSDLLIFRVNKHIYFCTIEQELIPVKQNFNSLMFKMSKDRKKLISLKSKKIIIYDLVNKSSKSQSHNIIINNPQQSIILEIYMDVEMILIQYNCQIQILDIQNQRMYDLSKMYPGRNLIISEDGKILINWKANCLQLQHLQNLEKMKLREDIEDDIKSCEYLADGQTLFIQQSNKSLFWNINTKTILSKLESFESYCFNHQKNILVTLSKQVLKIWSIKIKDQIQLLYQSTKFIFINKILFSKDGNKLILINGKGKIRCSDIQKIFKKKRKNKNSINLFMNSNSQQNIAISTDQYAIQNKGIITICKQDSKKMIARLGSHNQIIDSFAYSKDGQYLVSRSRDQKISIWNMQTFTFICQFQNQINDKIENHCLWFKNENNQYIVTNFGNQICSYNITQFLGNNPANSNSSDASNASQQNNFAKEFVVEPQKTELIHENIPNEFKCRNIIISKDHNLMAVAYSNSNQDEFQMDSTIIISQTLQMKVFNRISNRGGSKLAFCFNNKLLATNNYEDQQYQIIIWNIESCNHYKQFRIKTYKDILISSIEFSPSKNYILISDKQYQFYLSKLKKQKAINEGNFGLYQDIQTEDNLIIDHPQDMPILHSFSKTNTNCKFSNNNDELIYVQSNELKFINFKNKLQKNNSYTYDERDQFYFQQNLIIHSYNQRQLIEFNLEKQVFIELYQFIFESISSTFSQLGKYLAFVQKEEISIWKIDNKKQIQVAVKQQINDSLINLLKFSKDDQYFIAFINNKISIYRIIVESNESIKIELFQIITRGEKLISLNFHPSELEFLVITQDREIYLYKKQEQQQQEFQNFLTITRQKELQSYKTSTSDFKITSKIKEQNLLRLLIQKGAN
ncbi:unnamed protein product [Paramecium sonneborni]|uniref:WD40-repeat-containing domain n=1 Tax=Paramecium sonneborni TaxID=65129 RepID=A0A8S1PWE9_9CILI|nr:unnamed protein product [Paramecium sonneborni]